MTTLNLLKKTILSIFCCALFCAADGHVIFVQAFAWAKMTYSFAHQGGLKIAVQKTFDGQHPCQICKKLCRLKTTSPELTAVSFAGKLKFAQVPSSQRLQLQRQAGAAFSLFNCTYLSRHDPSPLRRPPRRA